MKDEIKKTIRILKNGGIVIFPTDTAFGIGCRMDDEKAVERLFEIRKRPQDQPVPVLVDSIDMIRNYVQVIDKDVEEKLMKNYWPGGLTIVLPAKTDKVPNLVRGGGSSIGVRMPDHETILEIIKHVAVPVLGPSANFHGEQTPFVFSQLSKELISKVDYVVNGECIVKKPSTVIDCTVSPWKILREGAIKLNF